jgi:hypothetical protein
LESGREVVEGLAMHFRSTCIVNRRETTDREIGGYTVSLLSRAHMSIDVRKAQNVSREKGFFEREGWGASTMAMNNAQPNGPSLPPRPDTAQWCSASV